MRTSTIDRRTRSLHRRWSALAVAAGLVAAAISSLSGGPDAWIRMVVGAASVAALAAACRERLSLRVGLGIGVLNAAIVPIEADADRTAIAAIAAIALLVAAEAVVTAQRLLTSAPVTSSRGDATRLLARTATAGVAVAVVAVTAQVDRIGTWAATTAAAVAVIGLVALTTRSVRGAHG